jgi:hypothetical protein
MSAKDMQVGVDRVKAEAFASQGGEGLGAMGGEGEDA